jgi:hypothetical protein
VNQCKNGFVQYQVDGPEGEAHMRDEEQRILDLLTIALRTSGKTKKEVDESRGWCRGTTSQLLRVAV